MKSIEEKVLSVFTKPRFLVFPTAIMGEDMYLREWTQESQCYLDTLVEKPFSAMVLLGSFTSLSSFDFKPETCN